MNPMADAIIDQYRLMELIVKGIKSSIDQAAIDAAAWSDINKKMCGVLDMVRCGEPSNAIHQTLKEICDMEYELTLDCKISGDILELWPQDDEE
jgi:hypothetical protein